MAISMSNIGIAFENGPRSFFYALLLIFAAVLGALGLFFIILVAHPTIKIVTEIKPSIQWVFLIYWFALMVAGIYIGIITSLRYDYFIPTLIHFFIVLTIFLAYAYKWNYDMRKITLP